ncbi:MAG: DUF2934 domain-containing protein [Cytophagaceae bacterium]|nr:DUF2934 domain-containing protein [Gemmatimonadaceae bacterium]
MPPKKRSTKKDNAPAATPVTPAVTPDKALVSRKAAAEPAAKAAAAKPPAKRTVTATNNAKPTPVTEAAVIAVPVVTESSAAPERVAITEDDVRRHAFYLSQRRKGPGDPVADWLEAERSLRNQRA